MRLINDPVNPLLEICLPSAYKIISLGTIMYIKADRKGSIITINDESKTTFGTSNMLCTYENVLSDFHFCRVHRKYIVNLSYIECYSSKQITLIHNQRIPLSNVKDFIENYSAYIKQKK